MATEIEHDGRVYLINQIVGAEDQFNIFRRILPILGPLYAAKQADDRGEPVDPIGLFMFLSDDIRKMSDEEVQYVVRKCLAVVDVATEGKPIKLFVNGRSMFGELDMVKMLMLVRAVLIETYRPFLKGPLASPSNGEGTKPAT
jgi:hypothetical protein